VCVRWRDDRPFFSCGDIRVYIDLLVLFMFRQRSLAVILLNTQTIAVYPADIWINKFINIRI